jgi:exosortase
VICAASILVLFVFQLKGEWTLNPQYAFGWGVPILGMVLFLKRWQDRPVPSIRGDSKWVLGAVAVLLAAWLPLRTIREANMDWRLIEWIIGFGTVALLAMVLWWMGGRSFTAHFFVPVFFLLLAIPWPTRLESFVVQTLTGAVVMVVVEAMRWMGVAAWASGSVIQLPTGSVGVEEACSGIRAFQGAVMCSIFIGEMFRLTILKRAFLLLIGIACALSLNFGRTLFLSLAAAHGGNDSVSIWHDGTGIVTLLSCFAVLWTAGLLLRGRSTPRAAGGDFDFRAISLRAALGFVAWIVFVEGATSLWFKLRRPNSGKEILWAINPSTMPNLKKQPIPERVQSILRFDEGLLLQSQNTAGPQLWVYALTWKRGSSGTPLARYHSPEVCLPAAGFKLLERPREFSSAGGPGVPFKISKYEWLRSPVYVFSSFYSVDGERPIERMDQFDLTWSKRLQAGWQGRRPGTQQVFQVVLSGVASQSEAEAEFQKCMAHAMVKVT